MASPYYTVKELSNIKNYKAGTTIDKSLIYQYLVSPFCARLVQYLPSWLAPNVLTLFGLLCNFINLGLAVTFLADNPDPPRWVYLACAWFLFVYMISDNSDGKQAVRTGSSTPLGEGLDHGCDSLIVGMTALTSAYVLGVPLSYPLLWGGYGYLAFYLAHWQEYFTHFLELGYFNGPTEAESFAILTYLFTFFVGRQWWHTPMHFPFGITVPPYQALSAILVFVTVFTIVTTLWKGTILALNKNISISRAYSQLLPITTSWVAGIAWVTYTPEVYYSHPAIFFTATNFLFSYLTINCIIQRMCDLPYQYFYWPSIGIFIAAANSFLAATGKEVIPSIPLLYALWFVWALVFLHFSVSVVQGLCVQLGVKALTIPYPNKATKKRD